MKVSKDIINVQKIIALVGLCLVNSAVFAGQKIDQSLDVDAQSYIEIEHVNGSAVVKGWDKSEVYVKGELSDQAEDFIFRRDGKNIRIEVEMKRSSSENKSWSNDDGDELTIYVPKTSYVSYSSVNASFDGSSLNRGLSVDVVNGAIKVDEITGKIRLESVNGNINADKLVGDVNIETVNGSITAKHSGLGEMGFESVNGNIVIHSDSQEIEAETVNGDIKLTLEEVTELDLNSVNGNIEVSMVLAQAGEVEVSTVGGSVTLNFQKGVAARFDIESHAGGRFVNRLSDDKTQKAKYGPRRWLEFTTGNGTARVDVSTVNGRVELESQ